MKLLLCVNNTHFEAFIKKGKTYTYDGSATLNCCPPMIEASKHRVHIVEFVKEVRNLYCAVCGTKHPVVRASFPHTCFIDLNDPNFTGDEDVKTVPKRDSERTVSTLSLRA